ncbi:MAG: tRNA uridine-5-carboxymethylaminomethyl(34) synthesis GTPase MnmE [Candidatus Omnitrophica bacterium]|nr:tRNA uridine-5-carboxymethylaminomethyl(34) synthesis GTPase MnmE [Candidatus Omnitrophota bacterium]
MDETIAAISTPIGKSGIGIVRLSGKQAFSIADKIFRDSDNGRLTQRKSHRLHYGWIMDGPERLDEVLLTLMRAPKTYTREDIVEINCHSGIVVLSRILQLVLKQGARLAEAGEFTRRAYLNGRIDLAQAEAVLDVINAQTKRAQAVALKQLQGGFSGRIKNLRKDLMEVASQLELSIDFSDQDVQLESQEKLLAKMDKVAQDVRQLLDTAEKGSMLRTGISCVICGRPNVGKSSLLNALLKKERAIVTPLAGTTRDSLEETIDLGGAPVRLIDTAGIVSSRNLAEKEAVKRARQHLSSADIVLLVLDASKKLNNQDEQISRLIFKKPGFLVLNKQDLPVKISEQEAGQLFPQRKAIAISALCGQGLQRLEKELIDFIWQGRAENNAEFLVTNFRHQQALNQAQRFLAQAIKSTRRGESAEIIALDVQAAQKSLGEIIGEISCADILGRIFSQFCIGK